MIADNIRVKIEHANDLGLELKSKIERGKLIINAYSLDDKIEYQGELEPNPYVDIEDIQELIDANKTIKIVTKTPTLLKIKVGAAPIELVGKEKIDLENLSETFEKVMKNQSLMEKQMKEQKEELNEHKDLIIGLKKEIEEMKLSQEEKDLKCLKFEETFIEEKLKLENEIEENLNEIKRIREEIRSEIESIKLQPQSYESLIVELKSEINELKLECEKISATLSLQSEELKQHESELKELIIELERKINCELEKLRSEESLSISRLNEPIRSCNWSEELKSEAITINNNVVTLMKDTKYSQFCLLNASFSNTLKSKQSWTIQINNKTLGISLGVCLKSKMNNNLNSENIKWDETGHGLYMIDSFGRCFSHLKKEFNGERKSFEFGDGDIIDVEYDPIDKKLRFNKNKDKICFEMPIITPPENDAYHPFVSLWIENDSVELIKPFINNVNNERNNCNNY